MSTVTAAKYYVIIFCLVLSAFAISAAQCWLNPRPGFEPYLKPHPKVALLWQYNSDSGFELATARDFPGGLRRDGTRINRPLFPGLGRALAETCCLLARPVLKLSRDQAAGLGYVALKIIINFLFALAVFAVLRRYIGDHAALLAVGLILLQKFVLFRISMYHTYDLEYATPVFIAFFVQRLGDRYTPSRNVIFSMLVGLLLLGRQNYGSYLAALGFGLYLRRFKEVVVSGVCHLIPLAVWLLILWSMGLEYKNYESDSLNQGSWLYKTFIHFSPLGMLLALQKSLLGWFDLLCQMHQGIWLLAGVAGLGYAGWVSKILNKNLAVFIGFCLVGNWLQLFASGYYHPHITADLWYIFFGAAAHLFCEPLEWRPRLRAWLIAALLAVVLAWNILMMVHLPWVHPFAQRGF